jgi:hypothetical protein
VPKFKNNKKSSLLFLEKAFKINNLTSSFLGYQKGANTYKV